MYYNHHDFMGRPYHQGLFGRDYESGAEQFGGAIGGLIGIGIVIIIALIAIEIVAYVLPIVLLAWLGYYYYENYEDNNQSNDTDHIIKVIIVIFLILLALFGYYHVLNNVTHVWSNPNETSQQERQQYSPRSMINSSLHNTYSNVEDDINGSSSSSNLSHYFTNGTNNTSYQQLASWTKDQHKDILNMINGSDPNSMNNNVTLDPVIQSYSRQSSSTYNVKYYVDYNIVNPNDTSSNDNKKITGNAVMKNVGGSWKIISNQF